MVSLRFFSLFCPRPLEFSPSVCYTWYRKILPHRGAFGRYVIMMELGAQLFTLRDYTQTEQDLDFSLGEVAKMGYKTVQLSAVGPIPAEKLRELCDKHGLKIVLTHWNPDRILNDTEAVIKEHEIMGCDYIGIGMMPKK